MKPRILAAALLLFLGRCYAQDSKVVQFARAIGRTEGFFIKGTIPNRLHNPGDLMPTKRDAFTGQIGLYHGYAVFKNDAAGWAALEGYIEKMLDGTSHRYDRDMTIMQIARVYAGNWRYWGKTVAKLLDVDPKTTLTEYFGLAPRVTYGRQNGMWMFEGRRYSMPVLSSMPQM